MKCPHCADGIFFDRKQQVLDSDKEGAWVVSFSTCPSCLLVIAYLERHQSNMGIQDSVLIRPKGATRPAAPLEVPNEFADDYNEACLVLPDSAKASAALSRRCLQAILREKAGATERDLAKQIRTVVESRQLPSYLANDLDAVRHIGNFAAHPTKSQHTGEVLPVETGEAEWNLDLLEGLFDFYFVAPARAEQRRQALNEKLEDAGKPPMN